MDKVALGIKNRKCLWYQNVVMFFYRRKKRMNKLYIYIYIYSKDQCEVKSQEYYQKYFGKLLLLLLLLFW